MPMLKSSSQRFMVTIVVFSWKRLKNVAIRSYLKPTSNLCKTTIRAQADMYYAAYIFRKQSPRASWCASCGAKYSMLQSTSVPVLRPLVSGRVFCFLKKIKTQLWIPPGLAHGFVVLSDVADFEYKCTQYYNPKDEACLMWNDPDVAIQWPVEQPILSVKDQQGLSLQELV
ncbi:Hypothetical Protein PANA_2268 [Pantoea ananatis LMG 20103]|uniref:dTDP-4-dehydrorhamnose 3,5-epimerase n=1 Tax=Pantoea ananatis (strain LMG 20103) TaxID=706191 RepID=D4GGY8_PANAM|nr:Hypothetical Protein PANA_2268 [Pantoea ananatis LMG 20103]